MRRVEQAEQQAAQTMRPEDVAAADVYRVMQPDGTLIAGRDPGLAAEELLSLYRLMLLNRLLDERMIQLQRQGRIGFYIGSIGEEACVLGAAHVLRPDDWLFPSYREHGAVLLRGMPLQRFLCNLFGNREDPVRGRQMPCHEAWREGKVASISSPLATQLPHAVGVGWAARLKRREDVALAFFGDGSTSTADFHVALNFAGVFKASTIFLCRNNQWAISVPVGRQTASESLAVKAKAYGIPGVRVDGNDLLAVIAVTREAHARARAGEGATLIEAITYRLMGHSTSDDPRAYRSDPEVQAWLPLDPLVRLRLHLERLGHWSEEREAAERRDIDVELRTRIAEAEKAGPPALESMFDDVFARMPWHLAEQRDEALAAPGPRAG